MPGSDFKALEMAYSHASLWFKIHADQRIKLFNFYIVLVAGHIAGFVTVLKEQHSLIGLLLACILAIITFSFKNLDQRTAALVKHSEAALDKIEQFIASETSIDEIRLTRVANDNKEGLLSYRKTLNIIFGLGYALAGLGVISAISPYIWICIEKLFISTAAP